MQGFGAGLFQVAYMDVVMATLPPNRRGIAGSLAMLTRTLGIVSGATLLTLIFHAVESSALADGQNAAAGFLTAYRATFRLAGCGVGTDRANGRAVGAAPLSAGRGSLVFEREPDFQDHLVMRHFAVLDMAAGL